jgi:hemoglobin/transferrin/lactoferrin receptor protein
MGMLRSSKPLCLVVAFASSSPVLLFGEDFLQSLDPTVVTAGRSESELEAVPFTLDTISQEFIQDNTRRSLPEVLQFTPGVQVQKTTYGHGSPFIRGFTGRQNLLLVDGVRFNNSAFRGGPVQYWNTVDPLSLERIELIKSQGSVLYGSDAVGGTVNALTKSAGFRDEDEGRFFNHGSAYYEFRSNGEGSHVGRVESATGVGGKYGLLLGVSGKDFGDIRDSGVGLMRNTGYPEQDLDLRFDMALSRDVTLTLLHQNVNQDSVSRWHSTVFNPGWQHSGHVASPGTFRLREYDQERSLTYLRVEGVNDEADAWLSKWSATVSYQTANEREAQDRSTAKATDRRYQVTDVDTLGFDLSFESPLGDGSLVYGLDYYIDSVNADGYRDRGAGLNYDISNRPLADDSHYDLFGAYAQYVWRPTERFELTGGGRYTYARAELGRFYDGAIRSDRFGAAQSWDDFTTSLRALFRINECWSVYGGASEAFRAPNLDDLSGNLTARSGVTALGSADVDPEEFVTYELGTRYVADGRYFNAAVFYTDIDGAIVGVPATQGSRTTVATNGRDGYVYGVELEGAWEFTPGWTVSGFAAWQDGRTETSAFLGGPLVDEPGSRLLPLTGSVALRWTHSSGKVWVEGRVLAAAEENRLSGSDRGDTQRIPSGGTPSYVVAMVHAGWQATEALELTCGLENLTNEDYRIHGSGQNEPGFNAIFGAKVSW